MNLNNDRLESKIDFMTLIVALKSKNGIVLAGDKRSSYPKNIYDDTVIKLHKFNDKVAVGAAGDRFDCIGVIEEMAKNKKIDKMSLEEIKDLLFKSARELQAKLIASNSFNPILKPILELPEFYFILAGISEEGIPEIYTFLNINLAPQKCLDNQQELGEVLVAKYIFNQKYREDMTIDELIELAKYEIVETSKISNAVSSDCNVISFKI